MLDFKTSIFLKLLSSIFFLLSGIIWKKLLITERRNYHFIYFRVIATLFFLVSISVLSQLSGHIDFSQKTINAIDFKDWIICISICLFSFWGLYFYTNAMQSGRYSFVTPLVVISSAFSFLTSLIVYNEELSNSKYVALGLIITGLFLHQKDKLVQFKISKEVILILFCSVFWGISYVFYLIPIKKFGVLNFSMILETCVLISCIGLLFFKEKRVIPTKMDKQSLLFCLLMGLMVAGGSLLSNFTLTQLPVSLNILIGLIFEILVLAIGLFMFREKLNIKDWMLIGFASVGSFLLLF